jgi:hypothetical protein
MDFIDRSIERFRKAEKESDEKKKHAAAGLADKVKKTKIFEKTSKGFAGLLSSLAESFHDNPLNEIGKGEQHKKPVAQQPEETLRNGEDNQDAQGSETSEDEAKEEKEEAKEEAEEDDDEEEEKEEEAEDKQEFNKDQADGLVDFVSELVSMNMIDFVSQLVLVEGAQE